MPRKKAPTLAIGLMSGTSLDGVDGALIRTDGEKQLDFIAHAYAPYTAPFRQKLSALATGDIPLNDVLRLEQELALAHVGVAKKLMQKIDEKVSVIGFHGQTIRHIPQEGLTWQLGNAHVLAEETGVSVVNDFRRRDMAAGGQGAPLVPLFHQAVCATFPKPLVVVNIGGVANITYLGTKGDVIAGDVGPGVGLLDTWVQTSTGKAFDENGLLAAQGRADEKVIYKALAEIPFFRKPFPKSADRYDFAKVDVSHLSIADGASTLCLLTAAAIAQAVQQMPAAPKQILVAGGGAKNPSLMKALQNMLPNVKTAASVGVRGDTLEAEAFAWLAVRRLRGLPLSIPSTTGAKRATVGGAVVV